MKFKISLLLCLASILINAQEIKFGKVSIDELQEKECRIDSTASAAYLYKQRNTYYEYSKAEGFIITTNIHERIKIYTKEGLDYANKLVAYYKPKTGDKENVTNIKGYTFNLKGNEITKEKLSAKQVFDEKKSKDWNYKKIAMPAVKVGSVIDLKYKIRSPHHTYIKDVDFQFSIPVIKYFTKVSIPEYFVFRKNSKGYFHIPPTISSSVKGIDFYNRSSSSNAPAYTRVSYKTEDNTFTANNILALKDDEPYVGNIDNYRGGLSYELSKIDYPNSTPNFYSTTWESVSKQIYKSPNFGEELKKRGYFKKDLTSILANTTSDFEKTAAIFSFIKTKIKWNKQYGKYTEQGVKKAYKEGSGNVADINLALTAMLREAGLNANPVLVSSKNNGIPLFPTLKGFNYVISLIEFEQGSILLDATEPYSEPNILPIRALNWNGRKVMKDGSSSWVSLKPSKHSYKDHKIYVKITDSNDIEGMQRSTFKNTAALGYRLKNNKLKEEDVIINLEEKHNLEIEDFKVLNDKIVGKPISRTIKFVKDDLIEEINNKLYINPLLHLTLNENPFKSNERKFPVDYIVPWQDKITVSITIPEGYEIASVPENMGLSFSEDLGLFKFIVKKQANKINIQSVFQINEAVIAPHHYAELKDFYNQIITKQTEKIVLIKK